MSRFLRRYRADQRGAAAAEFALVLSFLTIPILNAVDLTVYAWDKIQLNNAAQIAAQAAWATCDNSGLLPATTKCTGLSTAVTTAATSTSLKANVTVTSTAEHYYCATSSGTLVSVATPPTAPPADCHTVSGALATDKPGDYILITTSYTYTPLFSGVSIASLLVTPITRTAWMRLG